MCKGCERGKEQWYSIVIAIILQSLQMITIDRFEKQQYEPKTRTISYCELNIEAF